MTTRPTTLPRRAVAVAAVAAAVVTGLSTPGAAASVGAGTHLSTVEEVRTGGVARAADPWSPDPVIGEIFDMTSQGWIGDVPVGTTQTTSMTITAKQDLVLRPTNWYPGSEYFDFALAGTCPSSLFGSARMAPGDTCTVTWTMHPTQVLSVAAGWSFSATPVDASGTPTGPAVSDQHALQFGSTVFTAEDVDFGAVTVGSPATRPVTFHNGSAVDAYLAVDAPWGRVTIPERPEAPVLVPAGGELTLDAVYDPSAAETLSTSSWYRTTLPGSSSRRTDVVRFVGSGIADAVDPTEPPVDPTEPPVDPTEPIEPTDPTAPTPPGPTDPAVEPVGPGAPPSPAPVGPDPAPSGPSSAPAPQPAADQTPATAADAGGPPDSATGEADGVLASTGPRVLAMALGALTLVTVGAGLRVRSRALRECRRLVGS